MFASKSSWLVLGISGPLPVALERLFTAGTFALINSTSAGDEVEGIEKTSSCESAIVDFCRCIGFLGIFRIQILCFGLGLRVDVEPFRLCSRSTRQGVLMSRDCKGFRGEGLCGLFMASIVRTAIRELGGRLSGRLAGQNDLLKLLWSLGLL